MLTELDFSQNEFTVFVNEIWKLTNLKSLNVSLNKLLELPPSIKDLKALTAFDMSDNKVRGAAAVYWAAQKPRKASVQG